MKKQCLLFIEKKTKLIRQFNKPICDQTITIASTQILTAAWLANVQLMAISFSNQEIFPLDTQPITTS